MAKFLFVFHGGGGIPQSREDQERGLAAWMTWYQGMGAAVVDGGAPVGRSHTVSASGHTEDGGANPVSGYSIIEADSYDAACAHAAKNPMVLDRTGSVEVAEIVDMGDADEVGNEHHS